MPQLLGLLLAAPGPVPGAEDSHGELAVAVLRAFCLRLHHDAGRQMRDAHGGVGLVHVLPPRAAGPEGVDTDILVLDLDVGDLSHLRQDEEAGEARVAPLGRVEGRNPHETMDAALRLEVAVGVFPVHFEGDILQSGLITRLIVQNVRLEPVRLDPSHVHAKEHLRPILALRAAGAGVDGHDGVVEVMLPVQQRGEFEGVQFAAELLLGLGRVARRLVTVLFT